jgi:hypothetical protein
LNVLVDPASIDPREILGASSPEHRYQQSAALYLEACLKRFYIGDDFSLDCLLAQHEKRNTIFARSSNGGFWSRKVENALSFNGD